MAVNEYKPTPLLCIYSNTDHNVFTPTSCQTLSSGLQYKQEKFLTLNSPILIIGNHLTLLGGGCPPFLDAFCHLCRHFMSVVIVENCPVLATYSRNIVAKIVWRAHNDTDTQTSSSGSLSAAGSNHQPPHLCPRQIFSSALKYKQEELLTLLDLILTIHSHLTLPREGSS